MSSTNHNKGFEVDSNPITLQVITTQEAKTFLSVNHNEHDDIINDFILSATKDIEHYTNRAIEQRLHSVYWREVTGLLPIPRPPHVSIDSVISVDGDGVETNVEYSEYGENVKTVCLDRGTRNAVRIDYTAGYGSTAADIPQGIKTSVKWQLKLYYNNRNTGQDDFVQVDRRSGLVVQAKSSADDFVFYYNP